MTRFIELFFIGIIFTLEFFAWLSLLTLFLVPYLANYIFPELTQIPLYIVRLPEPRFTLLLVFSIAGFGGLLAVATKRIALPNLNKYDYLSRILIISSSYFLTFFFWKSFSFISNFSMVGPVAIFISLLFFLPLFYEFMMNFLTIVTGIFDRKSVRSLSKRDLLFLTIQILIITNTALLINRYVVPVMYDFAKHEERLKNRRSLNPVISKIEPRLAYQGNTVIIRGTNFELNGDNHRRLMSSNGPLNVALWTDDKIIFQIPLHVDLGDLQIWIEKPQIWEGNKITVNSNVVIMKIISRTDGWDSYDDAFFDQLQYLDKETLELNSYGKN